MTSAPPGAGRARDETENTQDWLSRVGLGMTNPFRHLDAGADPELSNYLVGHDAFRAIWHDSHAVVYAPLGGGKSAFRVRLAYACRVQEDQRRIFPILYLGPQPTAVSIDAHLEAILKAAAHELLLALAYRPARFAALDSAGKQTVRRALDLNDPGLLSQFLPQLRRAGSLAPLVETFDPSAARLPAPARPDQVRALCDALEQTPPAGGPVAEPVPVNRRFDELINLLRNHLGYEAIYLLVDGVDAFVETGSQPQRAIAVLEPLLARMAAWRKQRVYLKLFLPVELRKLLRPLTKRTKAVIIRWKPESLTELLRARLRAASRGQFDSLDAISGPSLRGVESALIKATPPVPRDLLALVNELIGAHVRRVGSNGDLEQADLEAALRSYRQLRSRASPS
ncbi:MAG: hypothetical protein JXM73_09650 [Anaerolineae bacterium]|nr:hypothetical protein [Anaerolineae bacterium]